MENKDQLDNSKRLQNLQKSELDDARNKADFVTNWISQTEFGECSTEASSFAYTSSVVDTESYLDDMQKLTIDESKNISLNANAKSSVILMNVLQQVINTKNNVQTADGKQPIININSVAGPVHIGDVILIKGPIHLTDTKGGHIGVINQPGDGAIKLTSNTQLDHRDVEEKEFVDSAKRERHLSPNFPHPRIVDVDNTNKKYCHIGNNGYVSSSQGPGGALVTIQTAAGKNRSRAALKNVIFPLLSELLRKYYKSKKSHDALDVVGLTSAFEMAERSSPGVSDILNKEIIRKLVPKISETGINTLMDKVLR